MVSLSTAEKSRKTHRYPSRASELRPLCPWDLVQRQIRCSRLGVRFNIWFPTAGPIMTVMHGIVWASSEEV